MSLNEWINTSSVRYIPPKRLLCYITGKLRRETPEEHVRQRVARSLVEEYGYKKSQIDLDFRIAIGSKKYPVDIAVFVENKPKQQENIYLITETKREKIKPTDKKDGIEQLRSYMGASLNCTFGLWTNGVEKICFQKKETEGRYHIGEILDIPPAGKSIEEYEQLDFSQLRPATELKSVFKRCHNYIHGNQGLPKDRAFHELLKVIFCKVYNERELGEIRFYVTNKEQTSSLGQINVKKRIDSIFEEVKERYAHIFKKDEIMELHPRVLSYIVGQLQYYSLLRTETDVKGDAYEELVGANLRGDRGEFFTPREVCKMAVESLLATHLQSEWRTLRIIDPACGTGGFLIAVINHLKNFFLEEETKKWGTDAKAINRANERLKEYCETNLFGIDINPLLVRTSQMNEVMHGNGSGNLFSENSLVHVGEWEQSTIDRIELEGYDLVFTNPPFGAKIPIDDRHTLSQYDLAYIWRKFDHNKFERTERLQRSVPPEQLFIERCLQLLKPKGRLAIVLPDSILNNPQLTYIRYWLLKTTKIVASFDLPRETFQPHVGTKTSVLFLEKKTKEEIMLEEQGLNPPIYDVFMAIAEKVGHDRRGNKIYRRTPEGERILVPVEKEIINIVDKETVREIRSMQSPIEDNDLPVITESFKEWWTSK